MMQAVEKSFSNLLPLLALLGGVLVVLLLLAFLVRLRIRRDSSALGARRPSSAACMRKSDVVVVLGRTFSVEETCTLTTPEGEALWARLVREDGASRLLLRADLSLAWYFPGQAEAPAGEPESLRQADGEYRRTLGPVPVAGGALAVYRGEAERCLAIERRGEAAILWRGKSIPPEGVSLLEDKGQPA